MFKKTVVAACLVFMPMASQAALISYNGYERQSDSKIVKGGGLEWLMWDVTNNMSISNALSTFNNGWSLATNDDMASLFNAFQFGKSDWNSTEQGLQQSYMSWSVDEEGPHSKFLSLFGHTITSPRAFPFDPIGAKYIESDTYFYSAVLFGSDIDKDGFYKLMQLNDDYSIINTANQIRMENASASISTDIINQYYHEDGWSVALVRPAGNTISPVPLPTSASILTLGFLTLFFGGSVKVRNL